MRIDQFVMSQETIDRLDDVLLLVGLDGSILDANPIWLRDRDAGSARVESAEGRDQ